jgi:hypothetical protein
MQPLPRYAGVDYTTERDVVMESLQWQLESAVEMLAREQQQSRELRHKLAHFEAIVRQQRAQIEELLQR